MKKLLVFLLVAGGVAWFMKSRNIGPFHGTGGSGIASLIGSSEPASPEAKARQRLERVMDAWKRGGTSLNDAAQEAACLWARNVIFISDREDLKDAADGFDRFRRAKSLYTDIASYDIAKDSRRGSDDGRGSYTIFDVTINGATHRIGVPDRANPLFWLD